MNTFSPAPALVAINDNIRIPSSIFFDIFHRSFQESRVNVFFYFRPLVVEIKAFDKNLIWSLFVASDKIYDIMVELPENEYALIWH